MDVRTRTIARVVAVAAGCLLVATGCSSEPEASSAPPGSEVVVVAGSVEAATPTSASPTITVETLAMVGDSITVGSQDELADAFEDIGLPDAEINAESGRRMVVNDGITSGLDGIAEVLAEGPAPDLWVIALGSNDVASYDADEYPAAIGELLAAIPSDAPLVWVDCYLTNYEAESAAFDSALREVLAERGNAAVVDWASVAASDGVLSDNVHPSGFGRSEFARRVIDGVDAWTG